MRLSEFIRSELETILKEWEEFATTLQPPSETMSALTLRDHAPQILEAVARDLSSPQTAHEQAEKSKGRAPRLLSAPETAAQTHAVLRAKNGFNIKQLAAEYRALRASVLRLWTARCQPGAMDLEDVMRFNEAIDQALAESIEFFSEQVDQSRNLLLGMLSHDMRTPLNAVLLTARYLAELNAGTAVSAAAASVINCGAAMKALLDDLVDFNRTKLGVGIILHRADSDLGAGFTDEVEIQRRAHPESRIDLHVEGDPVGCWDVARLQQVLRNLISNAIQHGTEGVPVTVRVLGNKTTVDFEVSNHGPGIALSSSEDIFDPLRRGLSEDSIYRDSNSLGLGLYIVREIVKAHDGKVEMRSASGETVFAVHLPRNMTGPNHE